MHKMIVILAVALPLLLCLLPLIGLLIFWFFRFRRRNRFLLSELRLVNNECAELKSKLATFPKDWDDKCLELRYTEDSVKFSSLPIDAKLKNYIRKWIDCDRASMNESPARIEAMLFPEILQPYPDPPDEHHFSEIPAEYHLTAGKDLRLFPNPHQYTPSDICTFLEHNYTRDTICQHIIISTILKAVSIDGNPKDTLLPFDPAEVWALSKLLSIIQGVELFTLPIYIRKFGFPHQRSSQKRIPGRRTKEDHYIDFFESLLEPYFTSNSEESIAQRRLEFEEILEVAVVHGMTVFGYPGGKIEYRWGMRNDRAITFSPAIYSLEYENMKLKFTTMVCNASIHWCGRI